MTITLCRYLGHCLIWGDVFLVLLAGHALWINGSLTGASYLDQYFNAGFLVVSWAQSLNGVLDWVLGWFLALPATLCFLLRFSGSSLLGIGLLRWTHNRAA